MIKKILIALLILPAFVYAQKDDFITLPTGLKYKMIKVAGQPKAAVGNMVKLFITYTTKNDSVIFSSSMIGEPAEIQLSAPKVHGDPMEGFAMLGKGDSAIFLILVDSLYKGGQLPSFAKHGDYLKLSVGMISNLTMEEYQVYKSNEAKMQVETDDKLIQDYIKTHNLDAQKTSSGLYYVITQKGTGPMPISGRKVKVNYTGKLLNGNIFDSSLNPGRTPFEFPLGQGKVIRGWDEGVALLPVGTKATLLIPSALGYGAHGMGAAIPANAVLVFEIEVLGVDDKPQLSNEDEIKNYIQTHNLNAQRTASGLYYIVDQQGSGAKPQAGKVVTVNYTGKLMDGTIFDSSLNPGREPFTFTLGVGQVISGWDEGIALFNVGGKGTLIIPSNLGYGEQGAGGSIPPNAVLIFEIEVVAAN